MITKQWAGGFCIKYFLGRLGSAGPFAHPFALLPKLNLCHSVEETTHLHKVTRWLSDIEIPSLHSYTTVTPQQTRPGKSGKRRKRRWQSIFFLISGNLATKNMTKQRGYFKFPKNFVHCETFVLLCGNIAVNITKRGAFNFFSTELFGLGNLSEFSEENTHFWLV